MNRTELIEAVAASASLDKRQAEAAVTAMTESVVDEIKAGNKVSIFGFGTFNPTSRDARVGRNPQTGDPVKIAASKSVRFAPASAFKTSLNAKKAASRSAKATTATAKAPAAKSASAKSASATTAPASKAAAAKSPAKKTSKRA